MDVFICYRRAETEGVAREIGRYLNKKNIGVTPFFYPESTAPGADWRKTVDRYLSRCDVLVAVIGKEWVRLKDKDGNRLLDQGEDVVRYEIATALKRGIRVIPLLVDGADSLRAEQLPTDLKDLAGRREIRLESSKIGDPLADEICRFKNWVIVSQYSEFGRAMRAAIDDERDELNIVRYPNFEQGEEKHNAEYSALLRAFLRDSMHGSWLFTVYPEDEQNIFSEDDETKMIEQLARQSKRLVCFESGENVLKRARTLIPEGPVPVGVIKTNSGHAIEQLIQLMAKEVWRKDEVQQIEIVSVMGPRCATSEERGMKYLEFFGCVQHTIDTKNSRVYEGVCRDLSWKVRCATVTRPLPTWLADDRKRAIQEFLEVRNLENKHIHTTFVCGNDDVAVTAYEIINETRASDIQNGRISFVGFDGMPCMDHLKDALKETRSRAATAYVNFYEMVQEAKEWLRNLSAGLPREAHPVDAREVS